MMLVNVIECRRPVVFAERIGCGWAISTFGVCANGTVEVCPQGETLLQAMAGSGSYDPDIYLTADNDNFLTVGPIRECSHIAVIFAGA